MATRGRKPGFVMSHEHRVKIQNSNILNALIEHVEGKRKMSSGQVTAGLGLLRKVLPDLSTVTHEGSEDNPLLNVTRIELVAPQLKLVNNGSIESEYDPQNGVYTN